MIYDILPINVYQGNNSATNFDFDFYIENPNQLDVFYYSSTGTKRKLEYGVDYSINELKNPNGSYITFPIENSDYSILSEDEKISLELTLSISQETQYNNSSLLNLQALEYSFDYLTRICQILKSNISRVPKLASAYNISDLTFPEPKANNVIQWSPNEDKLINYDIKSDVDAIGQVASNALISAENAIITSSSVEIKANSASTIANSANAKATQAIQSVESAVSRIENANTNAQNALYAANYASDKADNAIVSATSANTKADNAVSTANAASEDLIAVEQNVINAVETANSANVNSSNAISVANTSNTNASTALQSANQAIIDSTNAVNLANSALTTANSANTNANEAKTQVTTLQNQMSDLVAAAETVDSIADAVEAINNWDGNIVIDDELSVTSENAVQNKVLTQALNSKANNSSIPTKTSDLTNDSGFLTQHQDISSKQDLINSQNKLSADLLSDGAVNKIVTNSEKATWNNKQNTISDLSTIRTNALNGNNAYSIISEYGNIVTHNISEFATSAQGTKADSVLNTISNYGNIVSYDAEDFATSSQGAKADTAIQPADLALSMNSKQNTLVSGTNIKTINSNSILGSGNLVLDGLPSQSGNTGKFLTTDGTDAYWANIGVIPSQSGNSGKILSTDGTNPLWSEIKTINNAPLLGSGDIEVVTPDSLTETICVIEEYVLNSTRVRIWSNGLIEQWRINYSQSSAGEYTITYPVSFTYSPALFVDYHLSATASTSTTTKNYGYSRSKTGFYVYLAANAQINFYAMGY